MRISDWRSDVCSSDRSNTAQIAPQPLAAPAAIPASQLEEHSRTILAAMIAAAKADGHIGAQERQLLDAEIAKTSNQADRAWFDAQLAKPSDPVENAALAKDRKRVVNGKSVSVRVDLGGRRTLKKKNENRKPC